MSLWRDLQKLAQANTSDVELAIDTGLSPDVTTGEPNTWYHYVPRDANLDIGIISPEYALNNMNDKELAYSMLKKYEERAGSSDPQDILDYLRKQRESDRAAAYIYLLKHKIPQGLDPRLDAYTEDKKALAVDLDKLKLVDKYKYLFENESDLPSTPEDYYKNVADKMLFYNIPHMGILTEEGRIPPEAIKEAGLLTGIRKISSIDLERTISPQQQSARDADMKLVADMEADLDRKIKIALERYGLNRILKPLNSDVDPQPFDYEAYMKQLNAEGWSKWMEKLWNNLNPPAYGGMVQPQWPQATMMQPQSHQTEEEISLNPRDLLGGFKQASLLYGLRKLAQQKNGPWQMPSMPKTNGGITPQTTDVNSLLGANFVGGPTAFNTAVDRARANVTAYPTSYVSPENMNTILGRMRGTFALTINPSDPNTGFTGRGSGPGNLTSGSIGAIPGWRGTGPKSDNQGTGRKDDSTTSINPSDYLLHEGIHPTTAIGNMMQSWVNGEAYPSDPNVTRENAQAYYTSPNEAIPQMAGVLNNINRNAYAGKLDQSYGEITKAMRTPEGMLQTLRTYMPQNYYRRFLGTQPGTEPDMQFINMLMQIPH